MAAGTGVLAPRAVIVHRRSELAELIDRHGTRGQTEFFLRQRGRTLADVDAAHERLTGALATVRAAIPREWRLASVERDDLDRFEPSEQDVVIAVGPDGLVANAAKHLTGQPVIGVAPGAPGVLTRHAADDVALLLRAGGPWPVAELAMAQARTDDGQCLTALNEIYLGHASHQSARYVLHPPEPGGGPGERQSSSGLIAGTGTGATGWCASLAHDRGGASLPRPEERALAWFVREAWPSPWTSVALTSGRLAATEQLSVTIESEELVVFGDGIEHDRLRVTWGQRVEIGVAAITLRLVRPSPRAAGHGLRRPVLDQQSRNVVELTRVVGDHHGAQ